MWNLKTKLPYYLLAIMLVGTAVLTSRFGEVGMMGLTVFILAYLSKGIRRKIKIRRQS